MHFWCTSTTTKCVAYLIADVNECADNPCGPNALCVDTPGSFTCTCKEEYTGDPFRGCVDVNECEVLEKPCGTHAICENAAPGYNCICPQGYSAKPDAQVACEQVQSPPSPGGLFANFFFFNFHKTGLTFRSMSIFCANPTSTAPTMLNA